MPVSYPPTTMQCQPICAGKSDLPKTSPVEMPRSRRGRAARTGRTEGGGHVLRGKACKHPATALSRCSRECLSNEPIWLIGPFRWVPSGLSILSP
jgi:hypothetical protein